MIHEMSHAIGDTIDVSQGHLSGAGAHGGRGRGKEY